MSADHSVLLCEPTTAHSVGVCHSKANNTQVSAAKAISEPCSKELKKVTLVKKAHLIACSSNGMAFFVPPVAPVSEKFLEYQWLLISNRQDLLM